MTLDEAKVERTKALTAYNRALDNPQQFSVQGMTGGGRSQTQQNIEELRRQVEYWDGMITRLERKGSGIRIRRGVPHA